MDNDIYKKLITSEKNNQIVSIFTSRNNPANWSSGFVEKISDEYIILRHISPEGKYDGYIARRLINIYRLDVDGSYENRLYQLYQMQNQHHKSIISNYIDTSKNLFKELLIAAKDISYVVSICIDESEEQENITGYVKKVDEDFAVISKLTYQGEYDGESTFYLDDIILINCDTSDENTCMLLAINKNA